MYNHSGTPQGRSGDPTRSYLFFIQDVYGFPLAGLRGVNVYLDTPTSQQLGQLKETN